MLHVNIWDQFVAWIGSDPFWELPGEQSEQDVVGSPCPCFTCSVDISHVFSSAMLCPWLVLSQDARSEAPAGASAAAALSAALHPPPSRSQSSKQPELPLDLSPSDDLLPKGRLSHFPLFPCSSPICTFFIAKLPWQLQIMCGWTVFLCCCKRQALVNGLHLPLSRFSSRKIHVVFRVFLTLVHGNACCPGDSSVQAIRASQIMVVGTSHEVPTGQVMWIMKSCSNEITWINSS